MWVWDIVVGAPVCCVAIIAVAMVRARRRSSARDRRPLAHPERIASVGWVVSAEDEVGALVLRRRSRLVGLLCRIRARSLDRKLAAGRAPESGVLLAAHAERIASPVRCQALAEDWRRMAERPRDPVALYSARPRICRQQVDAAWPELADLLGCLTAPGPKVVRGIAMASLLLTDGAGPLFDARADVDLATALTRARRQMDPWLTSSDWT